ncbi:hypothetical protein KJ611_00140 [Patescibacteria group bacterium]|nr:hypothetical protein [Patescibacteria group bacterium]MBU1705650.1 hypothetical protein [Patescibacteria group bacterium]
MVLFSRTNEELRRQFSLHRVASKLRERQNLKPGQPFRTFCQDETEPDLSILVSEIVAQAEKDFDQAVAISADGTQIVLADWVLVISSAPIDLSIVSQGWWRSKAKKLYSGQSFRPNKILRSDNLLRLNLKPGAQSASKFTGRESLNSAVIITMAKNICRQEMRPDHPHQIAAVLQGWRQEAPPVLFITLSGYCPSPWPDGGEIINFA